MGMGGARLGALGFKLATCIRLWFGGFVPLHRLLGAYWGSWGSKSACLSVCIPHVEVSVKRGPQICPNIAYNP